MNTTRDELLKKSVEIAREKIMQAVEDAFAEYLGGNESSEERWDAFLAGYCAGALAELKHSER